MTHAVTLVGFTGTTPHAAAEHTSVDRVRVLGEQVWMVYRREESEWQRRRRCGLGAVAAMDVLDILMDLPAGMPVPMRSLGNSERRTLANLPAGVVRYGAGAVTRQLVPAVSPLLAIVLAHDWQSGAESASSFSVYCQRMVVLPEMPPDKEVALSQASLYGIGVAIAGATSPKLVVEPEPLTDWQPTPAGWAFSEQIYEQVRQP